MTSSIAVVVRVGNSDRALLRTLDTIARQRATASTVALAPRGEHAWSPMIESIIGRCGAVAAEPSSIPGRCLNAAFDLTSGEGVLVVPAGYSLHEALIQRCEAMLRRDPSIATIAASIVLRTADGSGELYWAPEGLVSQAILGDTRSVPPVFAIRRAVWDSIGRFDETLNGLIEFEFLLRLALAGHKAALLAEPLVTRDFEERTVTQAPDDHRHLDWFRAVVERHAASIGHDMVEVLMSREIRFGTLRELHRELLVQRDADLQELDRLRTETAHHRAYIEHHGRSGVDWGDLRRTDPISREWGYDRGVPVDRRYIDDFLAAHSSDVRGAVLEVQEDDFTHAFGGPRVAERAVLDIDASNQRATVIADLRSAPQLASGRFDCIILTQTLHVIDDMAAALRECHRILAPGGVLLATFPAASRVCLEYGESGDFWRLTPAGAHALCQASFAPAETSCDVFGNVLTNAAFLHGVGCAELTDAEFEARDPYYPVLTGVRARKTDRVPRVGARGVVLLYHRLDETPDVHGLGVAPEVFEAHLRWLRAECRILTVDELLSTPDEALPDRAVALTFDDGYEDNLRTATPLLQRYRAPASFFLTSRWLEEPGEYWWDLLERLLLSGASTPAALEIPLDGASVRLATGDADQRRSAHWQLHERLVHATLEERERAVAALRASSGGGSPRVRPMMADEVRQLAALPGVTIGAHTVNHLALPDQGADQLAELADCRAALTRLTGRPVDLFAYPYGALDRRSAALVRRSWRWGLSCDEQVLGDSFDAARVPRLDVKAWDAAEFATRVSRLFEPGSPPRRRAVTLVP